jgi:hypothetical protein
MGKDGSSCPATSGGRTWQGGSRPAAAPVPLSWSRSSASPTSCGYAVPLYDYAGERDLLDQWTARKDDAALAADRARRNHKSIDGLPALPMVASDRQSGSGRGAG